MWLPKWDKRVKNVKNKPLAYEAIVIGASTGGLNALQKILGPLPSHFPLPILVVQHRLPTPDDFLVFSLNESCCLTVKEAEEKEAIKPGFVYIAPANYHVLVEPDKTMSLSIDAKVCYSRPSVDVLFETAAEAYRSGLIGIILTGANHDGAAGLKKIKRNGGLTIAQDPATAEAKLMPLSAIRENIVDKILSLAEISLFLAELFPFNPSTLKQPSKGQSFTRRYPV
jgi:two-component system chemotaxis response regulator CheB